MFSAAVMWGNSAKSWNIMLTGRRNGGSSVMSRPSSMIEPRSGYSKPPIIRRVVVLPQPDGPSIVRYSPSLMPSEMSSTATTPPRKVLVTPPSSRMCAIAPRALLSRPERRDGPAHAMARPVVLAAYCAAFTAFQVLM